MISEELKKEIQKKFGADKGVRVLIEAKDVQGLLEKCKDAGFEVTEGDIAEFVLSEGEVSDEELDAVSGGGCGGSSGCSESVCSEGYFG